MKKGYSKEEIIALLQTYYEENDHLLNLKIYKEKKYRPSETTIRKKFGSWNEALEEAGLPVNRIVEKWYSKEDIIQFLKATIKEKESLTAKEYSDLYKSPSIDTIVSVFGSWNEAIRATGLKETRLVLTKSEVLKSLRTFAKTYPEHITSEWYAEIKWRPSITAITRHFGSWINALEVAGIESNYQFYTEEEMLEEIKRCIDIVKPKQLTMKKYEELSNKPSTQTIYKRFGSWKKALEKASKK